MRWQILFLMTGAFIFCSSCCALAAVEIKAELDRNRLTTDELLTYKLSVTSTEKRTPPPKIPKFAGFDIVSEVESSSISLAKSDIKNIISYVFILSPKDSGKFTIEPSQITIEGRTYQTETFVVEVIQGKARPSLPDQQEPDISPQQQEEEPVDQLTL